MCPPSSEQYRMSICDHTPTAVARRLGTKMDDAAVLQSAGVEFLLAAATGNIDLNAMARAELAARGLGVDGQWVGFREAARDWGGAGDQ